MATRTAPPPSHTSRDRTQGRYQTAWTFTAGLAVAVFATVAVLQSPWPPLLGLTLGLAALGGLAYVSASPAGRRTGRRFGVASMCAGVAVLTAVGAGHHPSAALATTALLASCAPWTLRWVSGC